MAADDSGALLDLFRLRPVLSVIAIIMGAIAVTNLGLLLLFGAAPSSLRRAEVLDPAEYQRVGEQIAAAERDLADPHWNDGRPLALVLGLSTAREDIDGASLGPHLCAGMRVLNLGSSGSSYRELAFYLRSLRSTHLRSALTLLAVHPAWLAERASYAGARLGRGALASLASKAPGAVARELGRRWGWGWLVGNRHGVHTLFRNALGRVREGIADAFELGMPSRFPNGTGEPWAARIAYHDLHASPEFLDQQLRAWDNYGWFDAPNFAVSSTEAESLRQLLMEARALGNRVVVVLLPEHSAMRQRVPPAAEAAFRRVMASGEEMPTLDLRARLPDEMFYDYVHVNASGRARVTTLLGGLMNSVLPCAPVRSSGRD